MVSGVALGLGAAFAQSLYYLLSSHYVSRFQSSVLSLLVLTHVLMAVMAAILLPWFWSPLVLEPELWLGPLLAFNASYLAAQFCLFQALKKAEASRVSSLLGLKIAMLAIMSFWLADAQFSDWQWMAVGVCTLAAVWLSRSGGVIDLAGLAWALATALCYALSDWFVKELLGRFAELDFVHGAVLATLLGFIVCGGILSLLLPSLPRQKRQHWQHSFPVAVCWLLAMLLLFGCFAALGVVFGNIVQASRGIISLLLVVLVVKSGLQTVEALPSRPILLRRLLAATAMLSAIAMFYLGQ